MVAKVERQFNSFVKGLITEASPLNFPENASIDEENMVLLRDGSRKRRLGLNLIPNTSILSSNLVSPVFLAGTKQSFVWESPSGSADNNIGVIRVYNSFWFCDLSSEDPLANLYNGGTPIVIGELQNESLQATSINGNFVVVSDGLNDVITFSYIVSLNKIVWERTPIMVRDIWGVDDGLDLTTRPSTLSTKHRYNLWNQGWSPNIRISGVNITLINDPYPRPYKFSGVTTSTISSFLSPENELKQWEATPARTSLPTTQTSIEYIANRNSGKFPSNSDVWHAGRIEDVTSASYGYLAINPFLANNTNNTEAPKSAFIIDAFNRGQTRRNLMAGNTSIPLDRENGRFSTVESYSGRVFYSGVTSSITDGDIKSPNLSNYIFFTNTITSKDKLSICYQEADPTSPEINDLVATDGGTIQIPEAGRIYLLKSVLGSLLVFSSNGIWEIYGDTGGFSATSYQLNRISSVGVDGAASIVEVNGSVLYWSKSGIYSLSSDPVSGRFRAQSVSLGSIQSLYNTLGKVTIGNALGYFEEPENKVRWLFNDTEEYSLGSPSVYNKELIFDLTLQAFYLNTLPISNSYGVCSFFTTSTAISIVEEEEVLVGAEPVYSSTDLIYVGTTVITPRAAEVKYLGFSGTSLFIASYNNDSFKDFSSITTPVDYSSFLVTGYDLGQSLTRTKYSNYLYLYFKKTETGYNEDLTFMNPSSCFIQTRWDWHKTGTGNKWGTPFQAYKFRRPYIPQDVTDEFDTGEDVIVSKNKVRGTGKALSLKVSSESGKDMHILGWGYDMLIKEVA
jgi:hypothetical protein